MSRPIVLGVAALLLFSLGFLAANTHVARGVIFPVTSYEADVNKDTRVNIADVGLVASKYGQTAPTATPVPSLLAIVGDRAFVDNGAGPFQLVDTDDGSVVTTYLPGVTGSPINVSCDGKYALLTGPIQGQGGVVQLDIVSTQSGLSLVSDTREHQPAVVARFTCPLKGAGGAFTNGTPVPARAVVSYAVWNGSAWVPNVRIYNLSSGQVLYEDTDTNGQMTFNCAHNAVAIESNANTLTHVRLSDGTVGGTTANDLHQTC